MWSRLESWHLSAAFCVRETISIFLPIKWNLDGKEHDHILNHLKMENHLFSHSFTVVDNAFYFFKFYLCVFVCSSLGKYLCICGVCIHVCGCGCGDPVTVLSLIPIYPSPCFLRQML